MSFNKQNLSENSDEVRDIISVTISNVSNLENFLKSLTGREYTKKYGDGISSIGAHIRHIVEFYELFLQSFETGFLDYDKRNRDELLEKDVNDALKSLSFISASLSKIKYNNLSKVVEVRESISENYAPIVQSTYERELVFISSHTVHHLGIIKTIMSLTGNNICDNFGKAPSTIIYENKVANN